MKQITIQSQLQVFIFKAILLACLVLMGSSLRAQIPTETSASTHDLTSSFDELVDKYAPPADAPGFSILISKEGKVIYERATGKANLEHDIDLTTDHVFRIGSITKQFTGAAILRLQEQNKLNVQDDITKYIPDYPTHGKTITIEHLLTHSSGIKSYTGMDAFRKMMRKDMSPTELIDVFKNEPMDFDPGTDERYNNSGYILLGHIIEVVAGDTYENYIENEFFKPLGMKNSYYGKATEVIPHRAQGYGYENDVYKNAEYLSMTLPYAAGSLLSTVGDLNIWYHAIMNDKVISADSRKMAHTSYTLNDGKKTGYGYGWGLNDIQGSPTIGHGGGINGFQTSSVYLSDEKVFVTIFSNCMGQSPDNLTSRLAAVAIGKPMEEHKEIAVSADLSKQYKGFYELAPMLILRVTEKDGKFLAKPTMQNETHITPIGVHEFYVEVIDSKLKFNVDDTEEINSLTLFQGGEHKARKIQFSDEDVDTKKFIGTYKLESGEKIVILDEEGSLMADAFGEVVELSHITANSFLSKSDVVKVDFNVDGDQASDMIVYMGGPLKAVRVE